MTAHAMSGAGHDAGDAVAARSNMLIAVRLAILSEAMLFAAFFAAYFVIRSETGGWPPAGQERPELILPGFNTFLLLSSSVTMQWSVRSIGRGNVAGMRRGLWLTLLLGTLFMFIQGYEFATNGFELGDGVFGATFYTLTGFHGAHVLAGLILMAILAGRARKGLITPEGHTALEGTSYYWHFVDVVWVVLFSTVYVL